VTVTTRCLVSDFVDEVMLGLDWLEEYGCAWNFRDRTIEIGGRTLCCMHINQPGR
jgi:hypothetical protein